MPHRANLWKLYAIRMLFWMHFFAAVLVPFFTDWGGISLFAVLALNAWFFACNLLLEVPTGAVADLLGRKWSLLAGSLVAAIGALVFVSAPSLPVFLLAEFIMAVAYTLHSGADEALAYDSLRADGDASGAASVLGRMEAFKLAGIIVGTLSGSLIAAHFGLPATMLAYVAPALVAALLALGLREPPGRPLRSERPDYLHIIRTGGRYFAGHRVIRLLALEAAISNALAWSIIWLFQPLLAAAGVALAAFGLVHALGVAAQIVLLSALAPLERLAGSRRRLILVASFLAGLAFLVLAIAPPWPVVVAAIVLGMATSLPRVPIYNAAIHHRVDSQMRATVLSYVGMLRQFAIVIALPVIGLLAERSLSLALAVMGVGMIVVTVLSRVTESHMRGDSPG